MRAVVRLAFLAATAGIYISAAERAHLALGAFVLLALITGALAMDDGR